MNRAEACNAIRDEIGTLTRALHLLEGETISPRVGRPSNVIQFGTRKHRRTMSKEAREKISLAQKKRWKTVKRYNKMA